MQLLYVLKSAYFFTSFDSDFFDSGTPENDRDDVKQVATGILEALNFFYVLYFMLDLFLGPS